MPTVLSTPTVDTGDSLHYGNTNTALSLVRPSQYYHISCLIASTSKYTGNELFLFVDAHDMSYALCILYSHVHVVP